MQKTLYFSPVTKSSGPNYVITSVQRGISDEQRGRRDRYLIGMSLRTICFIGAILTSGALQWALLAGAVFLPYIAVFIANAGREWDRTPFFISGTRKQSQLNSYTEPINQSNS